MTIEIKHSDKTKLVGICLPTRDELKTKTMLSMIGCVLETRKKHSVFVNNKVSSLITLNRNKLVTDALEKGCDYIMFFDSDMTFPPDTINRLIEWDKDVVCAVYRMRAGDQPINGVPVDANEQIRSDRKDLIQMRRIPTGVMLVKAEVFKAIKWPWFAENYLIISDTDGDVQGEDFTFSDQVVAAGFTLWCDAALSWQISHLCESALTLLDPRDPNRNQKTVAIPPMGVVSPPREAAE